MQNSEWVRGFRTGSAGMPRLVCFPHAGGSAGYYLRFAQLLAGEVEVLALQYPGRQDRRGEPFIPSVPELAAEISDVLADRQAGRYAFFGHSLGAVLAFEVARELERRIGRGPARLFASGRRAPSCSRDSREENVHLRDDAGVLAELRRLDGTDLSWLQDPELVELFLPAIRSDYQAIETYEYVPGPRLRCPITVLTGDRDPRTTLDEARAWEAHSAPGFDLRVLSGGHFFITDHWPVLAGLVRAELVAGAVTPENRSASGSTERTSERAR